MSLDEFFQSHDNTKSIKEVFISKDADLLAFPLDDNSVACIGLASLMARISTEYTAVEWHDLRFDSIAKLETEDQ